MSNDCTDIHRLQPPLKKSTKVSLERPASNFETLKKYGWDSRTISRLFSIARSSHNCAYCLIEDIDDVGLLKEDSEELLRLGYNCSPVNQRVSFWTDKDQLAGYMIVRDDAVIGESSKKYVFESVFRKYNHKHNCVAHPGIYHINVDGVLCEIHGVMFCQQNERNKRCAQVALRSLLSRYPGLENLSYAQINSLAAHYRGMRPKGKYDPSDGMSAAQIEGVLDELGIRFRSVNYAKLARSNKKRNELHQKYRYSKFLYDGAESGFGALVGFNTYDGVNAARHIVPVFGHTFNKDSWVPDSQKFYFKSISDSSITGIGYIPSDSWTSSFIGHDDNLGSDYCIPKAYLQPTNVDYVVELLAPGVVCSAIEAESCACRILGLLMNQLDCSSASSWLMRIVTAFSSGNLVLRSICVEPDRYLAHLAESEDWLRNKENSDTIDGFKSLKLPKMLWVVEVSLPQLFPANERKLGEIVIDATSAINPDTFNSVLWIRLPEWYYMPDHDKAVEIPEDEMQFQQAPSCIQSHLPVIVLD